MFLEEPKIEITETLHSNSEILKLEIDPMENVELKENSYGHSEFDNENKNKNIVKLTFPVTKINTELQTTEKKVSKNKCKNTKQKQDLTKHDTDLEEGLKKYFCETCEKSFHSLSSMKRHIKNFHESHEYNCSECEKTFSSTQKLSYHEKVYHRNNPNPIRCEICGKIFLKYYLKDYHIKLVHEGRKYKFECEICGWGTNQKDHLLHHKYKKHHEIPDKDLPCCEICGKYFRQAGDLNKHISTVHEGVEEPKLQCEHCGKDFTSRGGLKKHVETIHLGINKERYKCDKCNYGAYNLGQWFLNICNMIFDYFLLPLVSSGVTLATLPASLPVTSSHLFMVK